MTKEITKAIILQEMQNKLALREFDPAAFLFDETVVPVYNIEQHLGLWRHTYKQKSINAAGSFLLFTVPENEKWLLGRYDVVFMTGVFTLAGIYVVRVNRAPSDSYIYLDLTAAQNTSYHNELPKDVALQPGDGVYCNADGYTSTGNMRLYIDYLVETIR